jgi:tRNA dimethylallyltransferase
LVVAIVGPTASGKTTLGIELAKKFNAQIVCCDSRTIYRFMDIGTAKPTVTEQQGIAHHLLDIVEPDQTYTVAQYANDAARPIAAIHDADALPIVCGGTGLYFKAALEGLKIPEIPPDPMLRQSLNDLAEHGGNLVLHTQLTKLDPVSAARIHINDRFRLVRALEVSLVSGVPFSQMANTNPSAYNILWIGLNVEDRSFLQTRIRERLSEQIKLGLLTEVRVLYERYGDSCNVLMNTINYSEFIPFLNGEITQVAAEEMCLKNNYQLARRQLMWFKRNKDIHWFYIDKQDPEAIFHGAAKLVEAKLQI